MSPSAQREALVRRFSNGDLISAATLQDGMRWFDTSFGAVAYRRAFGVDVTLGAPLADPSDHAEMTRRFRAQSRRPIFCYVKDDFLAHVGDLACAGMGVDRHVDERALRASPAKEVRGALKKARRASLTIEPVDLARVDGALRQRIDTITRRYLERSQCTVEMSFINRPMSLLQDGLRRVYVLDKRDGEHDGVFGYAVLNPIFERGEVKRYLLDILRFEPTRLWGVWLSAVAMLADRLAGEGYGMSIGFVPLHHVPKAPNGSRALEAQVRWMSETLATQQYPRRLRELKSLIPGHEEPRYFASFTRLLPRAFFALMEASGVRFTYLFGPDLLRSVKTGLAPRSRRRPA